MLFEYLKSLTVTKNSNLLLEEYIPFLINRWLTFGIPSTSTAINETVNMLPGIDKEQHYKLLLCLLPKFKRLPNFKYIKKVKKDKLENDNLKMIAQASELSVREITQLTNLVELYKKTNN